ncbi:hypothetical protein B7494_g2675 [Chlorociboria aeruginascens]|nr:hypothetical protein B7494_g2675 [Chlorociboria aeruginascens]
MEYKWDAGGFVLPSTPISTLRHSSNNKPDFLLWETKFTIRREGNGDKHKPGLLDLGLDDQETNAAMSEPPSSTARPARKRRRPALSCQQCRKRKIKCDRNDPCGRCVQSKFSICSYSPGTTAAQDKCPGAGASDVARHVSGTTSMAPCSSIPNRARSIPGSSSTHASLAGLSPSTAHLSHTTHPSSYSTPIAAPGGSHGEEIPDNKVLIDRIQKLEAQLALSKSEISKLEQATDLPPSMGKFTSKDLRGTVTKTRFYGPSHWTYSYGAFDKIACLSVDPASHSVDNAKTFSAIAHHINELKGKCKTLVKSVKMAPYSQWLANPSFREAVPEREISDQLVNGYFRTSESIHRILHIPSFQREYEQYWDQPDAANPVFIIKLLLVMSIGGCFYQGPNPAHYRMEAMKWIFAAQTWLSSPFEKAKLHTSTIQIQCLLIIARQHYSISGDLVWSSAGTLLRTAIQMGFHRDPKCLPKMSILQAELRRRLWASILELNIQSSINSGMPFLIPEQDWDTAPPANLDDIDISETTVDTVSPKPSTVFTQTSLQIILLQVLRPRLEVIRYANGIRSEPSYDDALRIGAELSKACRDSKSFMLRIIREPEARVTQLNINLLDLSIRLFLLILHRPFAAKGMKDPHFYFSRKICLETAVTMLNYPSSRSPTTNEMDGNVIRDDYTQLKIVSGGFFKGVAIYAVLTIFQELYTQLEEEGPAFTEEVQTSREPLKQCLRDIKNLIVDRITTGENNIMGHMLLSVVLAQIEATEEGINPEPVVLESAKNSVSLCYELLKARICGTNNTLPVDTGSSSHPQDLGDSQDFGMDFTLQDWSMHQHIHEPWLQFSCEDGGWWHW